MSTRSRWLARGLAVALACSACQSRSLKNDTSRISAARPADAPIAPSDAPILAQSGLGAAPSLPEDPEAGARDVARWREHQQEEERERRLNYDRRRQGQHRDVIQRLREIRRSYAVAPNEPAIRRAQQNFKAALPKLEKELDAIDHWGVSSRLVPEYRKLLDLFSEPYPSARIASLSGDKASLTRLESDIKAHFESIDEQLREALESEDE